MKRVGTMITLLATVVSVIAGEVLAQAKASGTGTEATAVGGNWDSGFGPPPNGNSTNNMVQGFAVNDTTGKVYAVGSFTQAGGVTADYVARWSGAGWSAEIVANTFFPGCWGA